MGIDHANGEVSGRIVCLELSGKYKHIHTRMHCLYGKLFLVHNNQTSTGFQRLVYIVE